MTMHQCAGSCNQLQCGCRFLVCNICETGSLIDSCEEHKRIYPHFGDGKDYYLNGLGGIVDGIPQNASVCKELADAISDLNILLPSKGCALEVGAGIGRYAPMLMQVGLTYMAIEPSAWAAKFIRDAYCSTVFKSALEDTNLEGKKFSLVLAAHSLEHMKDARSAFEKMVECLMPGGLLFILVPVGTDLFNKDHHWFFTQKSLTSWFKEAGLLDIRAITKTIVKHEDFIYACGRKSTCQVH